MKKRVSAVIISDNKILLIRRVKPDDEYYVFPGGAVEEGENEERAMLREIREELSVRAKISRRLFEIDNQGRREVYFLIKNYSGSPELGGPEKERMSQENQYHPEWIELSKIKNMTNLYPREAVEKILEVGGLVKR